MGLSDEVTRISAGPSPSAAAGVSLPFLFSTAILSLTFGPEMRDSRTDGVACPSRHVD